MDRQIIYPGAIPLETDLLNTNKYAMIGLSKLAAGILGTSTFLNGLACTPTGPASLQVYVAPGEIYSLQNVDGTAYSSLAADTTHAILKQGISLDQLTLSCPAPVTSGQSVNYLIQVAYQDSDTGSTVLPYYNASNPSQAYSGPNNAGTSQNTVRKGVCAVNAKAGIAATTGSQTTPAPDAGYIGAFVVTVAYGQTQITSPNISTYAGAPFLPSAGLVIGGLQGNACNISSAGGTADAITGAYTPGITALTNGMTLYVRAGSANATTTPTFTPASGTIAAKTIVKGNGMALAAGDIAGGGHWIELQYDLTLDKWVLLNPATGVTAFVSTNVGQMKNLIINGGAQIAQRAVANLSTTPIYGQVDRFAVWGTGTAVSAGTITQDTASPLGRTGYALKAAGVTITGTGVVLARQRIESINARRLKNQTASFSVQVYHDVGSAINYVVTIRKPTAADNYTSTTVISTGSPVSVPNAAGTLITLPNVTMGDCSNGIEIEVQAQCGAVTTKNFSFTEWQIEEGTSVSSFERRDAGLERTLCQRYYEVLGDENNSIRYDQYVPTTVASSWNWAIPFKATKRTAATAVKNGTWSLAGAGSPNQPTVVGAGTQGVTMNVTTAATVGGFTVYTSAAGQNVTADAEL